MGYVNRLWAGVAFNEGIISNQETIMRILSDLFSSDVGLMSIGGIAFMLGMGVFFVRYFLTHMHEDEARARSAGK